jgi:hypothetical protein
MFGQHWQDILPSLIHCVHHDDENENGSEGNVVNGEF